MKKIISLFLLVCFSLPVFASEYILAPNDELEIKIVNQKNLDTKQAIAPDGTLSLPLLGRINAQGKTLKEFDDYLTSGLSRYIKNPQVVVYLTPRPIYVVQHDLKKNTCLPAGRPGKLKRQNQLKKQERWQGKTIQEKLNMVIQ